MIDEAKITVLIGEGRITNIFDFLILFGNLEKIEGNFPGHYVTIEGELLSFGSSNQAYRPVDEDKTFIALEQFKALVERLVIEKKVILKRKRLTKPINLPIIYRADELKRDIIFIEDNWKWFDKDFIVLRP